MNRTRRSSHSGDPTPNHRPHQRPPIAPHPAVPDSVSPARQDGVHTTLFSSRNGYLDHVLKTTTEDVDKRLLGWDAEHGVVEALVD